jgi:hypothetical protein
MYRDQENARMPPIVPLSRMIGAAATPNVTPAARINTVRGKTTKAVNKESRQIAAAETGVKLPKCRSQSLSASVIG